MFSQHYFKKAGKYNNIGSTRSKQSMRDRLHILGQIQNSLSYSETLSPYFIVFIAFIHI